MSSGGHMRGIQVSAKLLLMSFLSFVGLVISKVFLDRYEDSEC